MADTRSERSIRSGHMNVTHIDSGSLRLFLQKYDCHSMLDVGCGPGGQVKEAMGLGMKSLGIDGDPEVLFDNCLICDFHKCPSIMPFKFDLVWSIEVAEHIDEDKSQNFLDTCVFNCGKILVMTASNNPKPHLHVNCQGREYWIERICSMGMTYREDIYKDLLLNSSMKREFLIENGMVFSF